MVQVDKLVYGSGATRDAGFVIYIYYLAKQKENEKILLTVWVHVELSSDFWAAAASASVSITLTAFLMLCFLNRGVLGIGLPKLTAVQGALLQRAKKYAMEVCDNS